MRLDLGLFKQVMTLQVLLPSDLSPADLSSRRYLQAAVNFTKCGD